MGLQLVAVRSSCLEAMGEATHRSMAGSAGPDAVGERVGCGCRVSSGRKAGAPKMYPWPGTSSQALIPRHVPWKCLFEPLSLGNRSPWPHVTDEKTRSTGGSQYLPGVVLASQPRR